MNWLSLAISISATLNIALACSRVPPGTTAAKSPVDESYMVLVAGNPQNYVPGQKYNGDLLKTFYILKCILILLFFAFNSFHCS